MSTKKSAAAKTANANEIVGTISELTNGKGAITVNGQKVGQPELSVLTRLGFGREVGVAERPAGQRGPSAKIYAFPTNGAFAVARK